MDRSLPGASGPPRVALGYLALAHLALGAACVVTLWDSSRISGFFYHPKMIAVVHALTLGWISSTLIAILYLAAPRLGLRTGRFDGWVLAAWFGGASGLVSHAWIERFGGMTWSAGALAVTVLLLAARFAAATATAPLPAPVKLQIQLALLNLVGTAIVGVLLGIHKTHAWLPGYGLDNVFAHAHLAALGWAFPLIVAAGHLYADAGPPPRAQSVFGIAGTVLAQAGGVGLFVSLLLGRRHTMPFGLVALGGIALCGGALALRLGGRGARSFPAPRVSLAAAAAWLGVAAWIALRAHAAEGGMSPDAVMKYGVAALVGGLGQAVAGLALLWSRRWNPHPPARGAGWPAVAAWLVAPPLLLLGLGETRPAWILAGVAVLLLAVLWTAGPLALALRREFAA